MGDNNQDMGRRATGIIIIITIIILLIIIIIIINAQKI